MIQVLNNLLYYLNLAALLHSQNHNNSNSLPEGVSSHLGGIYPLLVKQIPPGPIVPGVVVKFVCSRVEGDCHNGRQERNISFQWEMYQYTEDQDGKLNNASVFRLPARDAEMEMEFNESVANPKVHCDLVCTISNQRPSSASIKLNFQNKDDVPNLSSPLSFTVLGITSRTAYFAWRPPPPLNSRKDSILPSGFVIEYKNGRGRLSDWSDNAKVLRHEIRGGHTMAACISNLSPWTAYHFRIFAMGENNISSVPSNPVSVYTLEDIPSASPVDVKVEADHESHLLKVSWKPPPRSEWNGSLLGYNIGFRKASVSSDSQPQHYTVHMLSPLERLVNPYEYEITVPDSSVPYEVVVQAFNNIGSGPFSKPVSQ